MLAKISGVMRLQVPLRIRRHPLISLTAHDVDGFLGTYVFGSATNEQIEVTGDHTQVVWTRRGAMGRPLFYLGENAFYPAGAEVYRNPSSAAPMAVRIWIAVDWMN